MSMCNVSISEACPHTVQCHVRQVQGLRETLGVGLEQELRVPSKCERQKLLQEVSLPIEIPADHSLAIKANLVLSWNKLHTLRW